MYVCIPKFHLTFCECMHIYMYTYIQGKTSTDVQAFVSERVCEVLSWGREALIHALTMDGFTDFVNGNSSNIQSLRDQSAEVSDCSPHEISK